MEWIVRSATIDSLQPLKQRVLTSLESAATACACTSITNGTAHTYADMIDNGPMVAAYVDNAARLGRTVVDPATVGRRVVGSTDMGNISYLVPSIHPMIKVAADGVAIHTVEFAEWARSGRGRQGGPRRRQGDGDDQSSICGRRPTSAGRPQQRSPIVPVPSRSCKRRSGRRAIRPSSDASP